MAENTADPAVVEQIAEEFLEQHRQGKQPSVDEFCDRYPEHADELRGFLPALVAVEVLKPNSIEGSGPAPGLTEIGGKQLERLGDYRILGEVGRGGMGVVYEAEQESLGRRVALKVLAHHLLNESRQVKRFLREARAAAKLHHTNIVPVFGVGEQNGHHYYVMQFIQGLGLDEVLDELRKMDGKGDLPAIGNGEHAMSAVDVARSILKERRDAQPDESRDDPGDSMEMPTVIESDASTSTSVVMPGQSELSEVHESEATYWDGVARIGIQVAEALEHAHEQGTLHRDIKPSNLLLDGHGQVWVTDFGLAKVAEADDLTHTGDILGTIRYMAPERFHGQCDARTDIYSLGITLYELLARRPAYLDPAREQLIKRIETEPPTPLSKATPGIPRDLETIVNKAIEKDPAHRYKTAQELADDLQRFVDDEPIHARRISLRERLVRWSRRNPALATAISVASIALILVAVLSVWVANSESRAADKLRTLAADLKRAYEDLRSEQERTQELLVEVQEKNERLTQTQNELQSESARLFVATGHGLMKQQNAQTAVPWFVRALSKVEDNPEAVHLQQFIRRGITASQSQLFQWGPFRVPESDRFEVSPDGRFIVTRQLANRPPREESAAESPLLGQGFRGRNLGSVFTLRDTQSGDASWTSEVIPVQGAPGRFLAYQNGGMLFAPDSSLLLVGARGLQTGRGFGARGFGGQRGDGQNADNATHALLVDLTAPEPLSREIELPPGIGCLGLSGNSVIGIRQARATNDAGDTLLTLQPVWFDFETGVETPFEHEVSRPVPEGRGGFRRAESLTATMNAAQTLLLTSIGESSFQVWDLDDPTATPEEFEIAERRLVFAHFAPDERHVLVGLSSRTRGFGGRVRGADEIRYLSLDGGEKVWSDEANVGAGCFDFSPDGGSLAVIETEEAGQPRLTIRSAVTGRQRQAMLLPRAAWRGMSTSGIGTALANMTGRMQLRYQRDGRSLLLATGSGLRQLDFPQSALLTTVTCESEQIVDFGFIRNGHAIYVFGQDRQQVFDLTTGGLRTTTYSGQRGLVSQDGAAMSVVKTITEQSGPRSATQDLQVLQVANLATGAIDEEFQLFTNIGRGRGELTGLSHDSAHFATAVAEAADSVDEEDAVGSPGRQTVLIRDSLTGDVLAEGHLSALRLSQWCVSPQSAWLAELNGLGRFVDLENLQTGDSWSLTMARAATVLTGRGGIAFSRGERWLVVASGAQLNVFDLHDPEFERTLIETDSIILDMALLPDNHTILTLENSGVLHLSDIDTGHSFSMELNCARAPTEFSVSTDGSRLATLHPGANGSQIRVWRMPQPIEGTAEQIETMVAQQTGITLDGRGVRELSPEEINSNVVPRADTDAVARWYQSRATDAIDDANWHAALWHLERWANEEPVDPTPHAWSAFCHLQQGDTAAAVDALERTRERTRGRREASFASLVPLLLKSTLVNKVPNEQVLEHLQHQLDLDPNSTESLLRRSWIEANLRRWPDAIRDREAVVQLRPDDHDIQLELTAYYLAAGGYDDAWRRHVAWMLDHSESTDTPARQATVALAGLIVPVDDDLVQRAAELADAARQRFRRDGNAPTGAIDRLFNNLDSDDDGKISPDEQQDLPPFFVAQLALPEGSEKSLTRDDIAALLRPLTEGGFGTRRPTQNFDVLLAKGIADYRRGDREEARENLNEALESTAAIAQETRAQVALIQLFLAMTANAENSQAAGEHMESARAILDAHVDDPTTYDPDLEWWIFAREVLKEAAETLAAE